MNSFGDKIRRLRREKKLPLRTVAAFLEIDPAILSKMERGQRKASRELVVKVSSYFGNDKNELLIAWMSDNLVSQVKDEEIAIEALKVAEQDVLYQKRTLVDRDQIIRKIIDFFNQDGRVAKAWIFGSFARGDYGTGSDIDLMITYSEKATGTLLDYADIKQRLEDLLKIKIDLVEEGFVKPFALGYVERDKVLIYG
jgi:predicted nucleotidyltransferase/plasmid maintenance system antidote protein VapI